MLCVEPVVRVILEDIIWRDIRPQVSATKFSTQALFLLLELFLLSSWSSRVMILII